MSRWAGGAVWTGAADRGDAGGDRRFVRLHKDEWINPLDAEARLRREIGFDSDLWIVEIENRDADPMVDIVHAVTVSRSTIGMGSRRHGFRDLYATTFRAPPFIESLLTLAAPKMIGTKLVPTVLEPHVGDLFLLPQSKAPPRPITAGESAAILFFTGVRYCRVEPDVPAPQAVIKRRRSNRPKRPTRKAIVELHA